MNKAYVIDFLITSSSYLELDKMVLQALIQDDLFSIYHEQNPSTSLEINGSQT